MSCQGKGRLYTAACLPSTPPEHHILIDIRLIQNVQCTSKWPHLKYRRPIHPKPPVVSFFILSSIGHSARRPPTILPDTDRASSPSKQLFPAQAEDSVVQRAPLLSSQAGSHHTASPFCKRPRHTNQSLRRHHERTILASSYVSLFIPSSHSFTSVRPQSQASLPRP